MTKTNNIMSKILSAREVAINMFTDAEASICDALGPNGLLGVVEEHIHRVQGRMSTAYHNNDSIQLFMAMQLHDKLHRIRTLMTDVVEVSHDIHLASTGSTRF